MQGMEMGTHRKDLTITENQFRFELPVHGAFPTVSNHGVQLLTTARDGPKFPAEDIVNIPFLIAWKDPLATGSFVYLKANTPKETEIISTPSAIASSKAAMISAGPHPLNQQALYTAILALHSLQPLYHGRSSFFHLSTSCN